ncbi:S24 family peptidase [Bacteroides sp. ET489]|uniref:S24 family peptidase n=1 Tax=Bacteroides sp. ET489 TaxID=3057126 RepID=UPI002673C8D6|nr:S24 family peptidase [Bacteroides sp. ET489]MDO3391604.1 S24 family peptidase [Bacteroides sp. ET489]
MEAWERIQKIIDEEGLNKNSFSKAIGISNNVTITRIINEKRSPSKSTCDKIVAAFPKYNLKWLLTGEGEMLNQTTPTVHPNAHIVENLDYMSVPVVHIKARCGYLAGYEDAGYIGTLPTMPVIVDRTYHGKYMIFEAEGDSMDDGTRNSICDGDKLLCREVRRDLWLPKLHINDWYFVIVHRTEGIAIKQIINQDENGNITCHSLNNMFNDYTLNLDDVVEIYNVIKVVERNMRL